MFLQIRRKYGGLKGSALKMETHFETSWSTCFLGRGPLVSRSVHEQAAPLQVQHNGWLGRAYFKQLS